MFSTIFASPPILGQDYLVQLLVISRRPCSCVLRSQFEFCLPVGLPGRCLSAVLCVVSLAHPAGVTRLGRERRVALPPMLNSIQRLLNFDGCTNPQFSSPDGLGQVGVAGFLTGLVFGVHLSIAGCCLAINGIVLSRLVRRGRRNWQSLRGSSWKLCLDLNFRTCTKVSSVYTYSFEGVLLGKTC